MPAVVRPACGSFDARRSLCFFHIRLPLDRARRVWEGYDLANRAAINLGEQTANLSASPDMLQPPLATPTIMPLEQPPKRLFGIRFWGHVAANVACADPSAGCGNNEGRGESSACAIALDHERRRSQTAPDTRSKLRMASLRVKSVDGRLKYQCGVDSPARACTSCTANGRKRPHAVR